jgi:hypothetical protein
MLAQLSGRDSALKRNASPAGAPTPRVGATRFVERTREVLWDCLAIPAPKPTQPFGETK